MAYKGRKAQLLCRHWGKKCRKPHMAVFSRQHGNSDQFAGN